MIGIESGQWGQSSQHRREVGALDGSILLQQFNFIIL